MKKYALIFPGQASQYEGMGKKVWSRSAAANQVFDQAEEILGIDIKSICLNKAKLQKTKYAQIAIFVCSVAYYQELVHELGEDFIYFAGHSVGEYAALVCSGCLDFESALKLVAKRGEIMEQSEGKNHYAMANMGGANRSMILKVCEQLSTETEFINLICDNSVNQKIIAGSERLVKQAIIELGKYGHTGKVINTLGAFHTRYLSEAQQKFSPYLRKQEFSKVPKVIMSNVTGRPYLSETSIFPLLNKQMINTVQWRQSIDYLHSKNVDCFIEVGAGSILKNIMKRVNINEKVVSMDQVNDIANAMTDMENYNKYDI